MLIFISKCFFFIPNFVSLLYVRKFFDVSPLCNEADFSELYFADVIIIFEFAILIYMYIEIIDFSLMSVTALK